MNNKEPDVSDLSRLNGDELLRAFQHDLINRSEYEQERVRRKWGVTGALAMLEERSEELQAQTEERALLPAARCVMCDRALAEIGGRRVVVPAELSPSIQEKVKAHREAGNQPWVCQPCGGACCRQCGAPSRAPMGFSLVNGDGSITYHAIFPMRPGCINPECKYFIKIKE